MKWDGISSHPVGYIKYKSKRLIFVSSNEKYSIILTCLCCQSVFLIGSLYPNQVDWFISVSFRDILTCTCPLSLLSLDWSEEKTHCFHRRELNVITCIPGAPILRVPGNARGSWNTRSTRNPWSSGLPGRSRCPRGPRLSRLSLKRTLLQDKMNKSFSETTN